MWPIFRGYSGSITNSLPQNILIPLKKVLHKAADYLKAAEWPENKYLTI